MIVYIIIKIIEYGKPAYKPRYAQFGNGVVKLLLTKYNIYDKKYIINKRKRQ
jgi:predicted DNA-binding helix-hairpin-helix protein